MLELIITLLCLCVVALRFAGTMGIGPYRSSLPMFRGGSTRRNNDSWIWGVLTLVVVLSFLKQLF